MLTKEEYLVRSDNLKKARWNVEDRYSLGWEGPLSPYGTILESYATRNGMLDFDSLRLHAAYAGKALARLQSELRKEQHSA